MSKRTFRSGTFHVRTFRLGTWAGPGAQLPGPGRAHGKKRKIHDDDDLEFILGIAVPEILKQQT